ncbi:MULTISPECIES: hypothetical protein [Silvimonas]|uniref:hypothetical protein n=1 Tax=Silvimonas TaxID=300264 RepID=UPI0024B37312|nr:MULTISPECIES: hypothetical protein [Silvimonas]MDR3427101.1 hypothetical protein [Silvimonas sp.]
MDDSVRQVIEQCSKDSCAGTTSFGGVVKALVLAGIESYYADYRAAATTFTCLRAKPAR